MTEVINWELYSTLVGIGGVVFVLFLIGVALVVAAWLLATPLTLKFPRLVQHGGRLVTRWFGDFLEKERPVAKFEEKDISPYFWPQGKEPDSEEFFKLLNVFADSRLGQEKIFRCPGETFQACDRVKNSELI